MFTSSFFYLSGPICKCQEQNLQLYIGSGSHIKFVCKTCSTELYVPWTQFSHQVICETPYPGKPKPKQKYIPPSPEELARLESIEESVNEVIKKKLNN